MSWIFDGDSDYSHLVVLIFEIANLISGIILVMTTAVLFYFVKKKERGITDPVFYVVTAAIFLLGVKKLITLLLEKWTAYPWYCTLVEVGITISLLILIWLLPALILRILAAASREDLLVGLVEETKSKIKAQDSATSLEIRNSELQAVIFKFDMILNIQHQSGNQIATVAELRNIMFSSGESHRGD
jgi:hypothetical protein